jgi:FkbM family methyltransferase
MGDFDLANNERLEAELFQANYGVKYYSEKFADLTIQVEQLTMFASEPSVIVLTNYLSKNISNSKSQLLQDLVIGFLFEDEKGFFCEFGAADGATLSNTLFLEKLGWDGIVAEPSIRWHELLSANCTCKISHECVYSISGKEVLFNEVDEGMFSSLIEFSDTDMHAHRRTNGYEYPVESISLEDLLRRYDAPHHVDFLSIDTEGSEFAILEAFDFTSFTFGAIFVEHNFTENRENIQQLLTTNGYKRVFSRYSRWDDWYLNPRQYDFLKSRIGDKELL